MSTTIQKQALAVSQNKFYDKKYIFYIFFIIVLFSYPKILIAIEAKPLSPIVHYQQLKQELTKLQADTKKRTLHEPWIKISEEFLAIYKTTPEWINRPFAIYYSALALEYLAKYSGSTVNAKKALGYYEILIKEYPKRTITENAILNIGKIYAEQLKNPTKAQTYFKKLITQYPNSEQIPQAKSYLEKTTSPLKKEAPSNAITSNHKEEKKSQKTEQEKSVLTKEKKEKDVVNTKKLPPKETKTTQKQKKNEKSPSILLNNITWKEQNNIIKITFSFSEPVRWKVMSTAENTKKGQPPRLVLELPKTVPNSNIKPGISFKKGNLKKLRVDVSTPNTTKILLDFSTLKSFKVETANNPFQIILYTTTLATILPKGLKVGQTAQYQQPLDKSKKIVPVVLKENHSLAKQLGLRVKTVLIDPGHGGNDSGAICNGIVESKTALDIAAQIGEILSRQGLHIHYTRNNNTWASLKTRTKKANELKADLMVSIHVNSNENTQAHGFETYYLDFARRSESLKLACVENATSGYTLGSLEKLLADVLIGARMQESRRFAETIQRNTIVYLLQKNYKVRDGGIHSAPFHVLMGSRMPSVLIEVGYCSNKIEAQRLASSKYRLALAEGIAKSILIYTGTLHQLQ